MSESPTISGLGQVSRTVSDIENATAWHRDVLGLSHLYSFGNLAFFDINGTRLALSQNETTQAEESILYFEVSDIAAFSERLKSHDAVILREPALVHTHEDGREEWMAFFNDPDGRPLAMMATKKP